jgi:hypothetical protein
MITRTNSADFFNKLGTRNSQNTRVFEYNCGGYALNTYSWYCPHNIGNDRYYRSYTEKGMQKTTQNAVAFMLKEFSDLRVIRNLWELKKDEYAIAFRIGQDVNDFHYCKRSRNGHWTHKMGGGCIQPIKKKDVFAPYWNNEYCGHLVLFAKKLPKKDLEKY